MFKTPSFPTQRSVPAISAAAGAIKLQRLASTPNRQFSFDAPCK
jgi:hypothetical protein